MLLKTVDTVIPRFYRSLLARYSGVWWPCAIQYLESGISSFHFDPESRNLAVGTALGQVLLYTMPKDYNSLDLAGKVQGKCRRMWNNILPPGG